MDQHWKRQANCTGVGIELFFPGQGAPIEAAKECCRGCVVQTECLNYALKLHIAYGIWGGASERERRRMRKQRRLQAS
jgi:WhiB family redox-sensing transcriptional regulator